MPHTLTQTSQNLESNQKNLRIANLSDKEFVFDLANDPIVRQTSFSSEPITWKEHCKWFDSQLKQKNPFYIVEYGNAPCGYVRFQESNDDQTNLIITVAISPVVRNKGLGFFAVKESCAKVLMLSKINTITALVKRGNIASINLFKRACFSQKPSHCHQDIEEFYYPNHEE